MKKILVFLTLASIAPVAHASPPADLQAKLDAFAAGEAGGASVVWVDADGPQFFQTGTFASNDSRKISADTQFELGSLTKVFNGLLLAETERQGKVSRLDPAAKFLLPADDPDQAKLAGITLLALTTHSAGLPSLPSNFGRVRAQSPDPYVAYDRTMLIEAFRTDGPKAAKNSLMSYSNFGAALLGQSLAAAWGTSYEEALRTHVLKPLGLSATTLGMAKAPAPLDLAPGHVKGAAVPNWTFDAFAPAGALRSSTREMALFLGACLGKDNGPLHDALEVALKPEKETDTPGMHIGMGWFLFDDPAHPVAWHNGATAGSHAFLGFDRKRGAGVVILANFQKASEPLGFGLLGAKPPSKVQFVKDADSYTGRYPLSPAFAIDITSDKGALRLQCTGQPTTGLREIGKDRFAVAGAPAEVTFERDASGAIVALVLHQNGQDMRGPRGDLPPPPKEITLPPDKLTSCVGSYALAPSFSIAITSEVGCLFAQGTGQGKFQLYPSAADEFFAKVGAIQVSFQRNASGDVIGLVLHQNGQDLPAKKTP